MRIVCALLCVLALASAATADVNLTLDNLAANGWKSTATFVWGGTTNATVTQTMDYGGLGNFRFFTGSMPNSWEFQWAGISTNAFAGVRLSTINSISIRNFGAYGDNVNNWQPPTFTFIVDKGDGNQRCITWKPWSNGNIREAGVWHEYNAATTGTWHVYETGANYTSLAALKAALPNAYFEYTAELPLDWGYASNQAFNVGNCPLYDEDRAWFSGAAGYVDWFEVNGVKYDLGPVPEPGSLLALGTGLLGLLGVIKRRR